MLRRQFKQLPLFGLRTFTRLSAQFQMSNVNLRFYSSAYYIKQYLDGSHQQMNDAIAKGVDVANSQNKNTLVAVGEDHDLNGCMLHQASLLISANNNGIKHLSVELSNFHLASYARAFDKAFEKEGLAYFDRYDTNDYRINWIDSYLITKHLHSLQITGIEDPRLDILRFALLNGLMSSRMLIQYRDHYMVNELLKINNHSMLFCGVGHLKGIMENPLLNAQYHVVGIDISGDVPPLKSIKSSFHRERLIYPKEESSRLLQIDPYNFPNDKMKNLVENGLSFWESKKVREEFESDDLKFSPSV